MSEWQSFHHSIETVTFLVEAKKASSPCLAVLGWQEEGAKAVVP